MRENNVFRQSSDRSYLCIVAIYAIHAILLNLVFVDPKLESFERRVTLPSDYIVVDVNKRESVADRRKNMSEIPIAGIRSDTTRHKFIISLSERENSTADSVKSGKNGVSSGKDYSIKSPDHLFSQSKSGGAGLHFLAAAKFFSVSRLSTGAINTAKSIIGSLSPAALGIISGCFVFLLTFTENV